MYYFFNWEQGEQFHERIHIVRASVYYLFFLTDSKSVCVRAVRSWRGDRLCSWRSPVTGGAIRHDRICVVRAPDAISTPPGESHFKSLEAPPLLGVSEPAPANHYKDVTQATHTQRDDTTNSTYFYSSSKKKVFFLTLLQALVLLLKLQLKSYKFLSKILHIF